MNNQHAARTKFMVELALMVAIIFVMAFTPLGYFQTMGLSITFLTVPVAVGAIILGPKGGAICGLAFGITSFIQCFGMSAFGAMLLSINPAGTFVVCVAARILMGWLTGLIYQGLKKVQPIRKISVFLASLIGPFLNTFFFMTTLVLFFFFLEYIQGIVTSLGAKNALAFVVAFVGVNGLVEAIVCFILGSVVSKALQVALKNR